MRLTLAMTIELFGFTSSTWVKMPTGCIDTKNRDTIPILIVLSSVAFISFRLVWVGDWRGSGCGCEDLYKSSW